MYVVDENELGIQMVLTQADSQFPLFLTLIIIIMNKPRFKRFYKNFILRSTMVLHSIFHVSFFKFFSS